METYQEMFVRKLMGGFKLTWLEMCDAMEDAKSIQPVSYKYKSVEDMIDTREE